MFVFDCVCLCLFVFVWFRLLLFVCWLRLFVLLVFDVPDYLFVCVVCVWLCLFVRSLYLCSLYIIIMSC